ncbi:hypothetical protein F5890DRAFT_333356 [Lentinula detonsa]|uniref:Uncharacterized protein n=1 Tax=Lentinula detonsa TaxID=2804962 RepID=A0AA38PVZ5_9AGAR|nr:hypothetical protein F5890DRAFT_333356 [Lentinula detonsa]
MKEINQREIFGIFSALGQSLDHPASTLRRVVRRYFASEWSDFQDVQPQRRSSCSHRPCQVGHHHAFFSAQRSTSRTSHPHSAHAVSGRINPTAIECLVCAQNTGQISELTQTTAIPAAGELEEILDATNSTRGAELLKRYSLIFALVTGMIPLLLHSRTSFIGGHSASWDGVLRNFSLLGVIHPSLS